MKITKEAPKCLLATGTPALNKAIELYPLLDVILPLKSIPTFRAYAHRYTNVEMRVFGKARVEQFLGVKRAAELHFILKSVMKRRLKKDVLTQLPDKTRTRVRLDRDEMDKVGGLDLSKPSREGGGVRIDRDEMVRGAGLSAMWIV